MFRPFLFVRYLQVIYEVQAAHKSYLGPPSFRCGFFSCSHFSHVAFEEIWILNVSNEFSFLLFLHSN